ncbi:MAG: ABC transporter ATP-binding protein [Dehalococcoidia bacterium]|nr:ABC transporter ATP-binding protein [Dehalococcoidia bacterium]
MGVLLEVKDLATYFFTPEGIVKAVDGITYDVMEGETLAIVGESGCGKSVGALSIIRLIASPPGKTVRGEVLMNGEDLLKMDDSQMRKIRGNRIGMVFQEPMTSLNPVLTIGVQMSETLELHQKLGKQAAMKRAAELLQMVGIPDAERRLNDYPHQFSGGMRQRVMIAMAMSCNPKLLIADEPTTALDVTIQAQVLEVMKRIATEIGAAIIVITHNLGVVARYADRVNVMYAGRIVERGSAKDIYRNPYHPYTLGLLRSVPRLDLPKKEKLEVIEGFPPDLINLPQGCPFRPRCRFAVERCAAEMPELMTVGPNHTAACFQAKDVNASFLELQRSRGIV